MAMYYDQPLVNPRATLQAPAIGLLVVSILYLLGGMYTLFNGVVVLADPNFKQTLDKAFEEQRMKNPRMTADEAKMLVTIKDYMGLIGPFYLVWGLVILLQGAVMILGAINMLQAKGRSMAFVGSIAAIVPCSCCSAFAMPIGIWALVALNSHSGRMAFQQAMHGRF